MTDRDDPILDACLQEMLGGQTPPDLSARILQAWATQRLIGDAAANGVASANDALRDKRPTLALPPVATQPALKPIPVGSAATPAIRTAPPRRRQAWGGWLVLGGAVAAAIAVGVFFSQGPTTPRTVVKSDGKTPPRPETPVSPHKSLIPTPAPSPAPPKPTLQIVKQPTLPSVRPTPDFPPVVETPDPPPPAIVKQTPPVTKEPSPTKEILQFVNTSFATAWKENGVVPSPAATDSEWCRRAFLRILGRIPTVDEVQKFTADRSRDRREKLVADLLHGSAYADEFARHWGTVWTTTLIGRTAGTSPNDLASRDGLQQYLTSALQKKLPYDQIVSELLTAEGSGKAGSANFNGAANFLLAGIEKDATVATARVSRLFLGANLQCAQCHHHPTNDWNQHDFWALNAFLRQMAVEKSQGVPQLVDRDLVAKRGEASDAEVYYQTPSGLLKVAYPRFIDGTEISKSGSVQESPRRKQLAEFVVHSPQMPRALVNRVWSQFFSYGFTKPVDDIGAGNQPAHPDVLQRLADEFVAHGHDLRSLMEWIVLSEPFQRSSKVPAGNLVDAPEAGATPLFSRYYTRQMQMEEVFDSLLIAAKMRKTNGNGGASDGVVARKDWLAQFSRPMATDDAAEETSFDGSVRQSLIMMSGDLMRRVTDPAHEGLLKQLTQGPLPFDQKVEHLFLSALSRTPTAKEKGAAAQLLKANQGKEGPALEDMWWALLNSNEFILDH